MELVYLWVEDYKNIHRQGFNFSPRFRCKYNEEKNELEIIDKDKTGESYPKNFFGDNINITAIVGENGSGKSGILKFLKMPSNSKNGFAIFEKSGNKFYLDDKDKYSFLKDYKPLNDKEPTMFPLFDYSFTYDEIIDSDITFPLKQTSNIKGVFVFKNELIRNQKNILLNYFNLKKNNQLYIFEKFFQPKTINIYFDPSSIKEQWTLTEDKREEFDGLKNEIIDDMPTQDYIKKLKEILSLLNEYGSYQKPPNGEPNSETNGKYPNESDFTLSRKPYKLGDDYQDKARQNIWHEEFQDQKLFDRYIKTQKLKQYGSGEPLEEPIKFNILSLNIDEFDELNSQLVEIILTSFVSSEFRIELIDKNDKQLSNLSFGEQQLIFILNQIYSLKDYSTEGNIPNNFIVLLDEIDIGFHPDWQKRVISYIVDFLKLIPAKNFHLIFASHSPFLISDLPKENIIFLEKYKKDDEEVIQEKQKEGNCKVLKDGIKKQTFGANIHTLLSDGFFMSDGLMGEFAKKTINNIIINLNDKQYDPDMKEKNRISQIINSIGEDLLKMKLLDMYHEKFTFDELERKKQELIQKKNALQVEIESIEKQQTKGKL